MSNATVQTKLLYELQFIASSTNPALISSQILGSPLLAQHSFQQKQNKTKTV